MRETYKFCNPHPEGKIVGDCVKRAICLAEGRDYIEVKRELNRLKKITGASKYNSTENWKYYVNNIRHYEKLSFPAVPGCSRMDGYQFAETHPTGSYILRMAKHVSACVDGVILDTWDCRSKCVYNAYKVR